MQYETTETMQEEDDVKRKVEGLWNVQLVKLPVQYRFDYFVKTSQGGIGMAEVKTRRCNKSDYDTYMLSLAKYLYGKKYATHLTRENGKPFAAIIIVRWNDCDGYYQITKDSQVQTGIGGRRDRGDANDTEPVAYIPIKEFREF